MNIRDAKFASVDLETTGLDPMSDEIIAIGIVPMEGFSILSSQSFYSLVKPKKWKVNSSKIHGISYSELEKAPTLDEISQKVLELLEGKIIVGFCIQIDYEFLRRALKKLNSRTLDVLKIDKVLSRFLGEKYTSSPTLEDLAKKYGVFPSYTHNALADAFIAAQIFQIQLIRLLKAGANTLEKLLSFLNEPELPII
ncbi:MAG: 3'-5' exonuclease [Archaeoglobaceae archaeon]